MLGTRSDEKKTKSGRVPRFATNVKEGEWNNAGGIGSVRAVLLRLLISGLATTHPLETV